MEENRSRSSAEREMCNEKKIQSQKNICSRGQKSCFAMKHTDMIKEAEVNNKINSMKKRESRY